MGKAGPSNLFIGLGTICKNYKPGYNLKDNRKLTISDSSYIKHILS
jgi:hypothetical protein